MEELASSLLNTLKRSSAPAETKLSLLNSLKSSIKHQRIPETAQPATIDCIRIAITTQTSATLVTAGFATLTHLIKRLAIQEETDVLFSQRANLLPLVLDKLGDAKDVHRQAASQVLCDLWLLKPIEIEKAIKEVAIQGNNVRAKAAGMEWVTKMHSTQALQFRNFVPLIVECLEHAEEPVRESAKANIIELFRDARDAAKADLKRQLLAYNVRRSTVTFLFSELQIHTPGDAVLNASTQHMPRQDLNTLDQSNQDVSSSDQLQPSTSESANIEPMYVQSPRELEDVFAQMQPCFENRESEDNWKARDTNITKLRRLLKGNAPSDYHTTFMAGIKTLLDGILKVANSLRTTMSTNGCHLLQELTNTLGTAMDPMVEIILQGLEKMSASTKNINGNNANATIDTIFARVSYHIRLLQHIWLAAQDKNVQPRIFVSGWLKTVLKKHMQNRTQFENSGGVDLADKAIRKCLGDPNPKAREGMRSTFWVFAQAWPQKAEAIMSTLDPKSRQLLEKDPANPSTAQPSTSFTSSVGPSAASNPRAAPTAARSSLKDTIAAQKKAALAAKRLPERPNSAMSSFSPVRQTPHSAVRGGATAAAAPQSRTQPSADTSSISRPPIMSSNTTIGSGLLSSAPMRRPRRPEVPRPATADLYANRRLARTNSPPRSPLISPAKSVANSVSSGKTVASVVERLNGQARSGELDDDRTTHSPRMSPARIAQRSPLPANTVTRTISLAPTATRVDIVSPSPSSNDDNFTIVIPHSGTRQLSSPKSRTDTGRGLQTRLSLPTMAEEDDLTLVMPRYSRLDGLGSPRAVRTHMAFTIKGTSSIVPTEHNELQEQYNPADEARAAVPVQSLSEQHTASLLQSPDDDPLIIFEDPTMENITIPMAQIESSRAVLEELNLNSQQTQECPDEVVPLEHNISYDDGDPATCSAKTDPQSKSTTDNGAEPSEDQRVLDDSIQRLRAGTLDAQGFETLLEVIRKNSRFSPEILTKLLQLLMHFISPFDATQPKKDVPETKSRSKALACVRAVVVILPHRTETQQVLIETLRETILASQTGRRNPFYLDEVAKTVTEIIARLGDRIGLCLDQVAAVDWYQYANDGLGDMTTITTALEVMGKLAASMRERNEELTGPQRTRLGELAVHGLRDLDPRVRRAGVNFCLILHSSFGQEHSAEFWKCVQKAGSAQVNMVAYHMARTGQSSLGVPA